MSNKLRQMKKHTKETKMKMIYECEKCGKSWDMWLQIGLEEHGENHKPVPYVIMCKCGGFARHVRWNEDIHLSESIPITQDMNYFANVPNMDCGKPVLR